MMRAWQLADGGMEVALGLDPGPSIVPVRTAPRRQVRIRTAPGEIYHPPPGAGRLIEHNPEGIEGRIALLRDMVSKSIRDPAISRYLALWITHGCPPRDARCELEAIWWFMHRNVRYTGDVYGYDTYQTARRTLAFRGGDCDDGFTLITTLAMGNGFPVKGRITANTPEGQWAHIYPLVGVPKVGCRAWVPFDWTLGFHRFNAHPPQGRFLEFDGHQIVYGQEITPEGYMNW